MTDADFAAAARKLAGVERSLHAIPVFARWRDQRDHLARLLREVAERDFEHSSDCDLYADPHGACECGVWDIDRRVSAALEALDG